MRGLHNVCANQGEPGGKQMDQKGARGAADTERSTQTARASSMRSERGGEHSPSVVEEGHAEPKSHAGLQDNGTLRNPMLGRTQGTTKKPASPLEEQGEKTSGGGPAR